MNNKKNLKMKPVGSEYMEQYNALLRYVFQVTEQELSSIGWQEREIIRAKFPTMEKADVLYGVTMQKQGVSQMLKVELKEAVNLADTGESA